MTFRSYHPAVNLIFFAAVITAAITFNQPVFLAISYVCPFIYSVILHGKKAFIFNMSLIVFIACFTCLYAYNNHFGITVLSATVIGNSITLEAVTYGAVTAVKIASVLMWLSCANAVMSSDKIIYLFGKITPKLSLFLSIAFRSEAKIKAYFKSTCTARSGIGLGRNIFKIISITLTWFLSDCITAAESMRSRGYSLKGRTAFSIYRFDNRDRLFVTVMFSCFTVLFMAVLLDQTAILYNPEIILNKITPISVLFYFVYAFTCLLPQLCCLLSRGISKAACR
jgi:energy-coupling factor transport system permease protein